MSPDDKALLSVLLDDEASPDEVASALALLERKPELMSYVDRHQWLRAHWQKEYAGPQLDLRAGIWENIAAEDKASEAGLVDELALRREARGLAKVMNQTNSSDDATSAESEQTVVITVDGPLAPSVPVAQSEVASASEASIADVRTETAVAMSQVPQKRWWQPVAQFAVAASVCAGVVGMWFFEQPPTTVTRGANLVAGVDAQPVPFNDEVARSQTAVASQFVASALNNGATVASTGALSSGQQSPIGRSTLVLPNALAGNTVVGGAVAPQLVVEPPVHESTDFVSLESLAAQERVRLQSYYMMHTGNSAMMQPAHGMQLVRIVDMPPSPQLRAVSGQ